MDSLLAADPDPQWLVRVLALLGNTLSALRDDQSVMSAGGM
jgi:hypothetical protein